MSAADMNFPAAVMPTQIDTALAKELRIKLAGVSKSADVSIVVRGDGTEESVAIPPAAFGLLTEILNQMANGQAVGLVSELAELTIPQTADLLNVSPAYVVKLIDDGLLSAHGVGEQRRIPFREFMEYRNRSQVSQLEAFSELVKQGQELNLGYSP